MSISQWKVGAKRNLVPLVIFVFVVGWIFFTVSYLFRISDLDPFQTAQERVKVSVFYEVLCPDSQDFITTQVVPGYEEFGSRVGLQLVPYGKAQTKGRGPNGLWQFECQHGRAECVGNTYHACVIDMYKDDVNKQLKFVGCTMSHSSFMEYVNQCARDSDVDQEELRKCAEGPVGNELLYKMGLLTQQATASGRLTFVPTTIVDGVDKTYDILANFVGVICSVFRQNGYDVPAACSK